MKMIWCGEKQRPTAWPTCATLLFLFAQDRQGSLPKFTQKIISEMPDDEGPARV
ncbi:MAG: hypothetical protein K4445_10005 [Deltaproteobacteria bacterium]|jgi:hypothetical protein|nr:hypothetical protein [Syntrophaceae bacterium]